MKRTSHLLLSIVLIQFAVLSCKEQKAGPGNGNENGNADGNGNGTSGNGTSQHQGKEYKEGTDYLLYERVRMLDKTGFTEPQEAYSVLMPKGWQHEDEIIWNNPGTACAGTFKSLKAKSGDGKYNFEMLPDILYTWNTDAEVMQMSRNSGGTSANCTFREPMKAEEYFRNVFAQELGKPEILSIESNQSVIDQMKQWNEASMRELQQYGAGQMQFDQTAINANVRWSNGTDGWVVLGVTTIETIVPNIYNGSYSKLYTTQVTKRIVFKYPSAEAEQAKNQFSVMMASFRTNPSWNDAVNKFWKDVRQQKHIVHVGRIKMMDEQTRRMGEDAIRKGNERLKSMDTDMRNWEASQASQDRMHTNFIKTIREVENYRDETGKIELSSGYNHAWSRGDGSSFIMSNNPNFDPAYVFKDQNWKEMKKVD